MNAAGSDGLLGGNGALLGVQALAVLAAAALAGGATLVLLTLLRHTIGVRVSMRDEIGGLDLSEHGEEAYFGGDVGAMAGPGLTIGQSVVVAHVPATGRRD